LCWSLVFARHCGLECGRCQPTGQIPAGTDADLVKHVPQVVFHGLDADVQLGGNLTVGSPGRNQAGDGRLRWGQVPFGRPGPWPYLSSAAPEVAVAGFHVRPGSQGGESATRVAEPGDGALAITGPAEAPAVVAFQQGEVEGQGQVPRPLPGGGKRFLGLGLVAAGGVEQSTTRQTGTIWYYEGGTFANRVMHLYQTLQKAST
jgi:hypothetical protein